VLIHLGRFNLSPVIRQLLGKGTPRRLQGLSADALMILLRFWIAALVCTEQECASVPMARALTRHAHGSFFRRFAGNSVKVLTQKT
jgi:hypothetical protein